MMLSNIFGVKPTDAVFLPSAPYAVRFNCQAGQLALGEDDFLGNATEISIIKVSRYFGTLGRTQNAEWLQIFYIPAPGCDFLPANTVCVSYIKTRSVGQFQQCVTRLMGNGVNPAEGVFKVSFARHASGDRNYYSVKWDWRERDGEAETAQLEQIASFMQGNPPLADLTGTREMLCIDGLSAEEVATLIETTRLSREPEPEPVSAGLSKRR
jgi:hypothetical protein